MRAGTAANDRADRDAARRDGDLGDSGSSADNAIRHVPPARTSTSSPLDTVTPDSVATGPETSVAVLSCDENENIVTPEETMTLPAFALGALSVAPGTTTSAPPLADDDRTARGAARIHHHNAAGIDGRAARDATHAIVARPPLLTVVLIAVPPRKVFWKLPLSTVVRLAVPPSTPRSPNC